MHEALHLVARGGREGRKEEDREKRREREEEIKRKERDGAGSLGDGGSGVCECVCVCVCVCVHYGTYMEIRGQLTVVSSLLTPCGYQGLSSRCQTWQQAH